MRLIYIFIVSFTFVAFTAAGNPPRSFYHDREKGWFWHEPKEEHNEIKEVEEAPVLPQGEATPTDEKVERDYIALDVKWLQENMDDMRIRAIENPTDEHLASYAYAQRLMLDLSTRFSTKMMDFMQFESELDENKRRPTSVFSLNVFKEEQALALHDTIKTVGDTTHLWYFYSDDCAYCVKQLPVLNRFANRYNMGVLLVSMDGSTLAGGEGMEMVVDSGLRVTKRFGINFSPAIVLAKNIKDESETPEFNLLSEGLITVESLEKITLLAARNMGVISQAQFDTTTEVRELNVLRNEEGVIQADKKLLEDDPGYLAELLRERLREFNPVGSIPVKGAPQK